MNQTDPDRRERYAAAIHDAMETDLSLVDQEPAFQALIARAAEAAMALADAEAQQQPATEAEVAATLARECVDRPAVIRWCADRVRSTDGDYAVLAAAEYLDDLATEIEEAAEAEPAPVAQQPAAEASADRIVAYSPGGRTLRCLDCRPNPLGSDWRALTAAELEDGGICKVCGVDVLIPQEARP